MGTAEGVDYSWSRPDPGELAAAGKRFAVRYLSYNTDGKNLDSAERDALFNAGLSVVLVWETTADAALGGAAAGRRHAADALTQAHRLGAPEDVVIYFAVDFNPTPTQLSSVRAYFEGIASVMPAARVGVYGGLRTMIAARQQSWAAFRWQTYAWSGGLWDQGIHARQYRNGVSIGGGQADLNLALVDYIGQWDARGVLTDWTEQDMDKEQARQLEATWRIAFALGRGLEETQYPGRDEPVSLRPFYRKVAEYVAAKTGTVPVPVTLSAADREAIAASVYERFLTDLGRASAPDGQGKESPPGGGSPSNG